jgi:S1-C subfamily serine protease
MARECYKPTIRRVSVSVLALALAALACIPGSVEPERTTVIESSSEMPSTSVSAGQPAELSAQQIEQIAHTVVQIVAAENVSGYMEPLWAGSGTIISPTGEILTNCHVACDAPIIIVLMTIGVDIPPEARYIAELTAYDEVLDLALIQIRTDLEGHPVSPTDLPYLTLGDSDALMLGDPVRIFGYPDVGGTTITFTTGAVSGFESAQIGSTLERVIVKTDAEISSGNSGGTAVDVYGNLVAVPTSVNPDVRGSATLGAIGVLRPVNLVDYVRSGVGPGTLAGPGAVPPSEDPDIYEPNDSVEQATPLEASSTVQAYISWEDDLDVYLITPTTTNPIQLELTNIPSDVADYDLYLVDETQTVVAWSEGVTSEETIDYTPPSPGRFWAVVASYEGASATRPYTLSVVYDGGEGSAATGGVSITGRAINANTGMPLADGVFGLLKPGVTCSDFFGSPDPDLSLVSVSGITDSDGEFELLGVPRGATYAAFFIHGLNYVCEDAWLEVYPDDIDFDLGELEMDFD